MGVISAAVLAHEAVAEQTNHTPPWVFGGFAFLVLVVALVVTTMINVDH